MSAAAELDEVPHDEEVAGEPELLDDVELTVDRGPRPAFILFTLCQTQPDVLRGHAVATMFRLV
jgi:hypothetical protein